MTTAPTPPRNRPGVVTTAAALQLLVLLLALLGAAAALALGDDIAAAMRAELESQHAAPDTVDALANGGNDPISLTLTVGLAVAYGGLALFNLRGANGARVTTWVLSGLLLLCSVLGMVVSTLTGAGDDTVDLGRMMDAGYAAAPGWYGGWVTVSGVVSLLCYLAVVVLLALPAANTHFRGTEPEAVLPPEAG